MIRTLFAAVAALLLSTTVVAAAVAPAMNGSVARTLA